MKNSKCYLRSIGRKEFSKKTRIMKEVERVMRKLMMVLVVLAFACGTMLMMSSCAKKQIGTGEAATPAAGPAPAPAPAPAPTTKGVDDADKLRGEIRRSRPRASTSTMTSQKSKLKRKGFWKRKPPGCEPILHTKRRLKEIATIAAPTSTTWLLATGERRLPRSTSMLLEFPWTE